MTNDERRERLHALAEVIDDFLSEEDAFILVVFPREAPEAQTRIKFDIISNHGERAYVADILDHALKGIDQHLLEEDGPVPQKGKPN
jgi:hypothetical protein